MTPLVGDSIMSIRTVFATLAIIVASASSSSAVPFTITYTGTVTGSYLSYDSPSEPIYVAFGGPATEIYSFDTDRLVPDATYGTLDPYGTGQLVSLGVSQFGGSTGGNTLDMTITDGIPTINSISSGIGVGYFSMYVAGGQGNFQFGTCPSSRPSCGSFFVSGFTITGYPGLDVAPVPGPAIGSGLPGLLAALAVFIGWRRTRHASMV